MNPHDPYLVNYYLRARISRTKVFSFHEAFVHEKSDIPALFSSNSLSSQANLKFELVNSSWVRPFDIANPLDGSRRLFILED